MRTENEVRRAGALLVAYRLDPRRQLDEATVFSLEGVEACVAWVLGSDDGPVAGMLRDLEKAVAKPERN